MKDTKTSKPPQYGSRFSEMKILGEGTYGHVFRGYDSELRRYVAVKKFKEMNDGNLGINMLVIREISLLRQLNHPNIIKTHDIVMGKNWNKDSLLIIMEVEDTDLFCFMKESEGKLTLPTIRFIIKQIIDACSYLHSNYVMHRDLKPDNILICRDTKVIKVSDLGFARIYTHAITSSAQPANYTWPIQAKYYRAPEVLLGSAEYSFKVDVWSIGCILGDLLCGDRKLFKMNGNDRYETENEQDINTRGNIKLRDEKKANKTGKEGDNNDLEDMNIGDVIDGKDKKMGITIVGTGGKIDGKIKKGRGLCATIDDVEKVAVNTYRDDRKKEDKIGNKGAKAGVENERIKDVIDRKDKKIGNKAHSVDGKICGKDTEKNEEIGNGIDRKKRKRKGQTDKKDVKAENRIDSVDARIGDAIDGKNEKLDNMIDGGKDTIRDKIDRKDEKKIDLQISSIIIKRGTDIASLHSIFQLLGYPNDTYASKLRLLPNYNIFPLSPAEFLGGHLNQSNHSSKNVDIIANILLIMEPRLRDSCAARLLLKLLCLDPSERTDLHSIVETADFFSEKNFNSGLDNSN